MTTLLIIIGIYALGVIIAFFVTTHYISKFNTKDNPAIGALLSWVTVIAALIIVPIVKLFTRFTHDN